MNFGKLYELIDRLKANEAERNTILTEIQQVTGSLDAHLPGVDAGSCETSGGTAQAAKALRTPGDLKPLVLKVLGGFKTGKTIDELLVKVQKARPATKKAALGAVLAGLVSGGKVTKAGDDFLLMPEADAAGLGTPGVVDAVVSAGAAPDLPDFPGEAPTAGDVGEALED